MRMINEGDLIKYSVVVCSIWTEWVERSLKFLPGGLGYSKYLQL